MSDVTIIGAGLAGLQTSLHLAAHGVTVTLVDRKHDVTEGIHTTGIFVRRTFEEFGFASEHLSDPISDITLYGPNRGRTSIASEHDEFRVGRMGKIYASCLAEAQELGVEVLLKHRFIDRDNRAVLLEGPHGTTERQSIMLIGADGARSRVALATGLSVNERWIVGLEEVFESRGGDLPRFHLFLDAKLAPGYLAWAVDDGEEIHIGVGGFVPNYHPPTALAEFLRRAREHVTVGKPIERRGGRIPVGGVLSNIAHHGTLLVGDAAGAVSPLTAGGLDPAMRLSRLAADVTVGFLDSEGPAALERYQGSDFRSAFRKRLLLRRGLETIRWNSVFDLAVIASHLPGGSHVLKDVFFGRGSFPDRPVLHLTTTGEGVTSRHERR